MFPIPHDLLTQEVRETVLWIWRGFALPAAVGLVFAVPSLWGSLREKRLYGEPLGAKAALLGVYCAIAVFVIWHARLF